MLPVRQLGTASEPFGSIQTSPLSSRRLNVTVPVAPSKIWSRQ